MGVVVSDTFNAGSRSEDRDARQYFRQLGCTSQLGTDTMPITRTDDKGNLVKEPILRYVITETRRARGKSRENRSTFTVRRSFETY